MSSRARARGTITIGEVGLIPIMNLVCLLIPFLLYTAAFVQFASIDVAAPRFPNRVAVAPPEDDPAPRLDLMLVITDQGFRLAASGGVLPEGCAAAADGGGSSSEPTVPLSAGAETCTDSRGYPSGAARHERAQLRLGPPACAYDFARLRECAARIHEEYPEERQIVIAGESHVDYEVLIRAMDATRGADDAPLFPEVVLSAGLG